ncbi:MAG: aminotransferase class V-fold PLP-dependent enzyme [Saprospiraceae bacterium]|nr:aminotransferase class V-fold PLP-dependent enzyme [Saprospiraceae bacterium]
MISRRNFLVGLTGSAFLKNALAAKSPFLDSYWEEITKKFRIPDNYHYFNNGTIGLSPIMVSEAVKKEMDLMDANGNHENELLTIKPLANFLKVKNEEIALTHNVTEGINIVAWGIPLKKGDEIILTDQEHVGGATPWLHRAKREHLKIKIIPIKPTANEVLDTIKNAVTKKTRVISVPHIPCTNGQILPIKEIAQFAKSKNIWIVVDGAHPPGMLNLDITGLGVDAYSSCCHKWMLGPKGTGFLYVNKERQEEILPTFVGAGSDIGWDIMTQTPLYKGYSDSANRYFYGTQNSALYKGIVASIDFLNGIGMEKVELRCRSLAAMMQQEIIALGDRAEMVSPTEASSRSAIISFRLKNMDHNQFYAKAIENGFRVRSVPENGINCIRVSTHIYNQPEEIQKFIEWVYDIA